MRTISGSLLAAALLLCNPGLTCAMPTIAIDLDPSQAGIQANLTVSAGDSFSVAVVYIDDGATSFDTVMLDLGFNDAGSVLAAAGPPTAGVLVTLADAIDIFAGGSSFLNPGDALTAGGVSIPAGYAANIGGVGISSLSVPFAGTFIDILNLEFTGSLTGTSRIAPLSFAPNPPGIVLANEGNEVVSDFASGQVTVIASPELPEPGTWMLFILGLAVLSLWWKTGPIKPENPS